MSGDAGPILIGVGMGIFTGGLGGLVTGGLAGAFSGALVGGTVGAAAGGLGLLLKPEGPKTDNGRNQVQTTSIRNIPVPILFGRARLGGNWIACGNFFYYKDAFDGTPGVRLRQMHGYLALCEGPIQKAENFYLDGKTLAEQEQETELDEYRFQITVIAGDANAGLPEFLATPQAQQTYGFDKIADPVAWRNTAMLQCAVNVGQQARLAEIMTDVTGPDLSIRRSGKSGEVNPRDTVGTYHYDAYSESFIATLASSAYRSAPFGLVKTPRERGKSSHTQPPVSVTQNIRRGWYLGRHDVLLMQDPVDCATFHIGYWGIGRDSSDWEKVNPDGGYKQPIAAEHMDELNGVLHTLHAGAANFYLMRWNLLTGRITRLETSIPSSYGVAAMMYSPDHDAYIIAVKATSFIHFVDANTGLTYHSTQAINTAYCKGLCVSGSLVGMLSASGIYYYDTNKRVGLTRKGGGAAELGIGELGGIAGLAVQNTWTGHVTLVKPYLDSAAYVNCIPTWPEAEQWALAGWETWAWCRDWSYRTYGEYSLHALEGSSSVAAAMWNLLVDEPNTGSGRWGAGLRANLFSLSSFESVHAYAVGAVLYTFRERETYGERYKLDLVVDSERSAADVLVNDMLAVVNGYRTLIDGKMHVGVQRGGLGSQWHFTDAQIQLDSASLSFLGRASTFNRVRIDFPNIEDEWRADWVQANDEYDQSIRGRVVTASLSSTGICRKGHAQYLAQQLIDLSAANRRQVKFKTHWIGFLLSPGDGIEITSQALGLKKMKARVISLQENENSEVEITAVEHELIRDLLRIPPKGNSDPTCLNLAKSAEFRSGIAMMPMHAAVYEDPDAPQLIPLAALSPRSKAASQLRADYKFDDDTAWTSLGKMDSNFGGFLLRSLSATQASLMIQGMHGTPERFYGDLPVLIGRHEYLGPQSPRPGSGDEVLLATDYDPTNQSFTVRRPDPQSWTIPATTIAEAWRVHAVVDDQSCYNDSLFAQAKDPRTGFYIDVFVPADKVTRPSYVELPDARLVFFDDEDDYLTDEPGTVFDDFVPVSRYRQAKRCDNGQYDDLWVDEAEIGTYPYYFSYGQAAYSIPADAPDDPRPSGTIIPPEDRVTLTDCSTGPLPCEEAQDYSTAYQMDAADLTALANSWSDPDQTLDPEKGTDTWDGKFYAYSSCADGFLQYGQPPFVQYVGSHVLLSAAISLMEGDDPVWMLEVYGPTQVVWRGYSKAGTPEGVFTWTDDQSWNPMPVNPSPLNSIRVHKIAGPVCSTAQGSSGATGQIVVTGLGNTCPTLDGSSATATWPTVLSGQDLEWLGITQESRLHPAIPGSPEHMHSLWLRSIEVRLLGGCVWELEAQYLYQDDYRSGSGGPIDWQTMKTAWLGYKIGGDAPAGVYTKVDGCEAATTLTVM